jgi:hypothetical protein
LDAHQTPEPFSIDQKDSIDFRSVARQDEDIFIFRIGGVVDNDNITTLVHVNVQDMH